MSAPPRTTRSMNGCCLIAPAPGSNGTSGAAATLPGRGDSRGHRRVGGQDRSRPGPAYAGGAGPGRQNRPAAQRRAPPGPRSNRPSRAACTLRPRSSSRPGCMSISSTRTRTIGTRSPDRPVRGKLPAATRTRQRRHRTRRIITAGAPKPWRFLPAAEALNVRRCGYSQLSAADAVPVVVDFTPRRGL
jgi:hypothetical protein